MQLETIKRLIDEHKYVSFDIFETLIYRSVKKY